MDKTIIRKETTARGNIVLSFSGDNHAEGMLFKNEEEFQMFRGYLNIMDLLGATSIERLG
jgi:hypothetical protein